MPETSVKAKRENAKTLRQAEDIILAKTEALMDEKAQAEAAKDKSKMQLADLMDTLIAEYKSHGRSGYVQLRTAKGALMSFRPDSRLCDIDRKFCTDYADWLKGGYHTKDGKPLEKQPPSPIFGSSELFLPVLVKKNIKHNPWKLLSPHEKI